MKLTVLGSTGSIGVSTLDVVARHPGRFEVVALTGHRQVELLAEQCRQFRPAHAVVGSAEDALRLARMLKHAGLSTEVLHGAEALVQVAGLSEVDAVMAAIVGAAGLPPTLAAARAGKRVLLANKEALVMAGAVFMSEARRAGALLLPIDSEHNAIFQSMPHSYAGDMDSADRFRRTVPYHAAGRADADHARAGGGPSQLGDGQKNFGRFGDHDEQGPRSDRGALAVRCAGRQDRSGDSPAKRDPFPGRLR
jgi:hypothetical protein